MQALDTDLAGYFKVDPNAGVLVTSVESDSPASRAGIRSGDMTMPEEINRILTDQISDLLYTTERSAHDNLAREGILAGRMHFAGNVMIDSLLFHKNRAVPAATPSPFDTSSTRLATPFATRILRSTSRTPTMGSNAITRPGSSFEGDATRTNESTPSG